MSSPNLNSKINAKQFQNNENLERQRKMNEYLHSIQKENEKILENLNKNSS